jgi:hypothetical protein
MFCNASKEKSPGLSDQGDCLEAFDANGRKKDAPRDRPQKGATEPTSLLSG